MHFLYLFFPVLLLGCSTQQGREPLSRSKAPKLWSELRCKVGEGECSVSSTQIKSIGRDSRALNGDAKFYAEVKAHKQESIDVIFMAAGLDSKGKSTPFCPYGASISVIPTLEMPGNPSELSGSKATSKDSIAISIFRISGKKPQKQVSSPALDVVKDQGFISRLANANTLRFDGYCSLDGASAIYPFSVGFDLTEIRAALLEMKLKLPLSDQILAP